MSDGNGHGLLSQLPRHEVRRLVSEEALGRIDALEDKAAKLRAVNNLQAQALETAAGAITRYATDLAMIETRMSRLETVIDWHFNHSWRYRFMLRRRRVAVWFTLKTEQLDLWLYSRGLRRGRVKLTRRKG